MNDTFVAESRVKNKCGNLSEKSFSSTQSKDCSYQIQRTQKLLGHCKRNNNMRLSAFNFAQILCSLFGLYITTKSTEKCLLLSSEFCLLLIYISFCAKIIKCRCIFLLRSFFFENYGTSFKITGDITLHTKYLTSTISIVIDDVILFIVKSHLKVF